MSTVLEVTELNAIAAYNKADDTGKDLLSNLFGKKVFNRKISDRVKSFEDACAVLGITYTPVTGLTNDEIAYQKLKIIAQALNEGWVPDWSNGSQYKWYPWFKYKSGAGFGFSHSDTGYVSTLTFVGSRLCFKSDELATYAGKQFEAIYNEFLSL